jgi:hypothetical protein
MAWPSRFPRFIDFQKCLAYLLLITSAIGAQCQWSPRTSHACNKQTTYDFVYLALEHLFLELD